MTRIALLIATDNYTDSTFRQLRGSRQDATVLAEVLADVEIGGYQVRTLENRPSHEVRLRINEVFTQAGGDDLVLLYFSGHGVKDQAGRLHLVTTDTRRTLLAATAVSAHFVRELIDHSPARKVVVWLDCCFGGAFPAGMIPKAEGAVDVLPQLATGGRGCAVMTASTSIQFAFEPGDRLSGQALPSVFTGVIAEGLRTGDADRNDDGEIDANELYGYVYDRVRAITPDQTPTRNDQVTGELYIARSRRGGWLHPGLPADIRWNLRSASPFFRKAAVQALVDLASSDDSDDRAMARDALDRLCAGPNGDLARTAREALAEQQAHLKQQPQAEQGLRPDEEPRPAREPQPEPETEPEAPQETAPGNEPEATQETAPRSESASQTRPDPQPPPDPQSAPAGQPRLQTPPGLLPPDRRVTIPRKHIVLAAMAGLLAVAGFILTSVDPGRVPLFAILVPAIAAIALLGYGRRQDRAGSGVTLFTGRFQTGAAAFRPDGTELVVGTGTHLHAWDTKTWTHHQQNARIAHCLTFNPTGDLLAGTSATTVEILNSDTWSTIASLPGKSLSFSPDGTTLAIVADDLTIWRISDWQPTRTLRTHQGRIRVLAISPDGSVLASTGADATIALWETTTWQRFRTLFGDGAEVLSMAFSPNDSVFAATGRDRTIKLWNADTWKRGPTITDPRPGAGAMAFSPSGNLFAYACADDTIRIMNTTTWSTTAMFPGHRGPVTSLAFSPDDSLLASVSVDRTVRLWPVRRRR